MSLKTDFKSAMVHFAELPFWPKVVVSSTCFLPAIAVWFLVQLAFAESATMLPLSKLIESGLSLPGAGADAFQQAFADYMASRAEVNRIYVSLGVLIGVLHLVGGFLAAAMWGPHLLSAKTLEAEGLRVPSIPREGGVLLLGAGGLLAYFSAPKFLSVISLAGEVAVGRTNLISLAGALGVMLIVAGVLIVSGARTTFRRVDGAR